MDPKRWKEIEALAGAALDAPDRHAFLREACAGDPALLHDVEQLLEVDTAELLGRLADAIHSSVPHEYLSPGSKLGPYTVIERLGSGGSSDVYKALDSRLDRPVALKVFTQATLADDFRSRFEREAKAAAALNHPNIATVYDVGEDGELWYIAMECVDGMTFREKLRDPRCSIAEKLGYLAEAAGALARAHSKAIVHCDLKPENIMLMRDGRVKVLDFGIARLVHSGRVGLATTRPHGLVEGTVGYMSPEQAAGREVGAPSDVFSFGCMLFEAATNKLPFGGDSVSESLSRLMRDPPPRIEAFGHKAPAGLQALVDDCLARDPAQRLPSMQDVEERLKAILRKPQRLVGRLALVITAVLALVAAVALVWQERVPLQPPSVAVIPFVNTQAPERVVFAEGISEGLINALASLPNVRVIARSSSFRFHGDTPDVQAIARTLGVRMIVTGHITDRDGRLQVNTELTDGKDGTVLWGAEFTRNVADLVDLQAQIAGEIARRIQSKLTLADQRRLLQDKHPNPEVYSLLLRGRYQMSLYTPDSTRQAASLFEQALGIDPGYAVANAELANTYRRLGGAGLLRPTDALRLAEQAALKAIAKDDNLSQAHTVLADIRRDRWDWPAAQREYKRAIEVGTNFVPAHQGLAITLSILGQADAAVSELSRLHDLDPIGLSSAIDSAAVFYNIRRFDRALQVLKDAEQLDPGAPALWTWTGIVTGGSGDLAQALETFEKAIQLGDHTSATECYRINVLARLGRRDEALSRLDVIERREGFNPPVSLAIAYAGLGNRDKAIGFLQAAFAAKDPLLQYVAVEPFLDSLTDSRQFTAIRVGMGLPPAKHP